MSEKEMTEEELKEEINKTLDYVKNLEEKSRKIKEKPKTELKEEYLDLTPKYNSQTQETHNHQIQPRQTNEKPNPINPVGKPEPKQMVSGYPYKPQKRRLWLWFLVIGVIGAIIIILSQLNFAWLMTVFQDKNFSPTVNVDVPENPVNVTNNYHPPEQKNNFTTIINIDINDDIIDEIADRIINELNLTNST